MPVRPPSGTVTFLFTSIQDSMRRWDEAPAEMAAAQPVHDAIVREAIEGHGGHVFAIEPDGFGAAFATAASAAETAVQAQRKLRADATIGFAVRMGLHTAEAVEQDGSYSGSEVNRAARLTALARRDQRNREHLIRYHQNALARLGLQVIITQPGDGTSPPPPPHNPGQAA